MLTASWAVQPATWANFDEHGCDWATDINNAYDIARGMGEPCVIWRVPNNGNAMKWVRCEDDTTQAI